MDNGSKPAMPGNRPPTEPEQKAHHDRYVNAPMSTPRLDSIIEPGLTKQELFAAMAMQGIMASMSSVEVIKGFADVATEENKTLEAIVSEMAVRHSSALLTALEDNND